MGHWNGHLQRGNKNQHSEVGADSNFGNVQLLEMRRGWRSGEQDEPKSTLHCVQLLVSEISEGTKLLPPPGRVDPSI